MVTPTEAAVIGATVVLTAATLMAVVTNHISDRKMKARLLEIRRSQRIYTTSVEEDHDDTKWL